MARADDGYPAMKKHHLRYGIGESRCGLGQEKAARMLFVGGRLHFKPESSNSALHLLRSTFLMRNSMAS